MATLDEGFSYSLSSNEISSTNKALVHVKLTDTALKIIEEYLKKKSLCSLKPSIQFQGNAGSLQIPTEANELRTFLFSLSAIQGEPNGSFDAVCHQNTKTGSQLTLEGSMANKIQILATNELFKATKDRVTQAELDSKKNSTKVIKQSRPHISRKKMTMIRSNSHLQANSQHQSIQSAKPKPSSTLAVNYTKQPLPSYASQGHAISLHNPLSTKLTSPSVTPTGCNTISQLVGHPAVISMPYRDRIIHLLAIRPYKKPELIIRLRKDGIRDRDKDSLGTILNLVAVLKDNSFTLAKHLYSEVKTDWPFYTDGDRQILKKKLQSMLSLSPTASPAIRSPDSQSNSVVQNMSESQKRPFEDSHSTYDIVKKKHLSHHDQSSQQPSAHASNRRSVSSTMLDKKENIDNTVDTTSDMPEYMRKYFKVTSHHRRCLYAQHFNAEYAEYMELHSYIDKISKNFQELDVILSDMPKDSVEYQTLDNRIKTECIEQKKDPKYRLNKKRFAYLHKKLAHIKKLILDYDESYHCDRCVAIMDAQTLCAVSSDVC